MKHNINTWAAVIPCNTFNPGKGGNEIFRKPKADYLNAIKEAISAVESVAREISGDENQHSVATKADAWGIQTGLQLNCTATRRMKRASARR